MLQSDDNNEKRLPMDVVNFESNEPEPNASENNEPERNAAESMVLLTSRSTQHRLFLSFCTLSNFNRLSLFERNV